MCRPPCPAPAASASAGPGSEHRRCPLRWRGQVSVLGRWDVGDASVATCISLSTAHSGLPGFSGAVFRLLLGGTFPVSLLLGGGFSLLLLSCVCVLSICGLCTSSCAEEQHLSLGTVRRLCSPARGSGLCGSHARAPFGRPRSGRTLQRPISQG